MTGSYRGTGQVIADNFVKEGARVFYHGNDETPSRAAAAGGLATWGDITTDDGAAQVKQQVSEHTDHLDVLVNNLGQALPGNWQSSQAEDWINAYQLNTLSAVRMIQAFTPAMPSGGRVINLGTIGSDRPNSRMPHYYAAKGALANLTVSLAKELGSRGITVNLVSPGLIRTPEVEAAYLERARAKGWGDSFEAAEAQITAHYFPNPLGRMATRQEVADVVLFLASTPAAFVNAQNIRVDGGALDIT